MQEIAQRQNVGDGEFDSDDDESSCSVWRTGAYATPNTGACDTKSGKPLPPQAVERLLYRSCVLSSAVFTFNLVIPLTSIEKTSRAGACMQQSSSNLPDHKIIMICQSSERNRYIQVRNNRLKVIYRFLSLWSFMNVL